MMKEPRFCNICGEKLLVTVKISDFDIFTGEKRFASKTFRCPNYRRFLYRPNRRHYMETVAMKSPPEIKGV